MTAKMWSEQHVKPLVLLILKDRLTWGTYGLDTFGALVTSSTERNKKWWTKTVSHQVLH